MDKLQKVVNITYDDRGRRQFALKESGQAKQTQPAPKPTVAIDYSKPLQARTDEVELNAKLGKRKLATDEDISTAAPFKCPTCDFSAMDSNSWLDHLNSQTHNRMLGNHMKVEKVTVSRVKAKLERLKTRKETGRKTASSDEDETRKRPKRS